MTRGPDHPTVQRTSKPLHMADLKTMTRRRLDEHGVEKVGIAADRTGVAPGQASLSSQTHTGRMDRRWVNGVDAVPTTSPFILAWRSS